MSFSDDDKEALGEDLDHLKTSLEKIYYEASATRKHIGTLVTMAWVLWISNFVGLIALVIFFMSGN
jgi:hypothetical protein